MKKFKITERKKQIIELVAEGKSDRAIAAELTVRPPTIRTHINAMFNMLGINSRCELIAWGFRNGVLK